MEYLSAPDWSPDGKWIVLNDMIGRIWMISADGDSFVKITEQGRKFYPSFSPDGKKIAFSTTDSNSVGIRGIRILDLESGIEKFVFPYGAEPSWFPDGSKLVFYGWLWQGNRWVGGVLVVDTSGENVQMVHKLEDYPATTASFSPDGSKIVFYKPYTYTNGISNIWVINTDGSNPHRLTKEGGRWPSWSPDGKKIVYTRVPDYISLGVRKFGIAPGAEGIGDLYIINPDGSGEKRITFFYPR